MDVKLIITDLDGTLLRDSKYISDYTKNVLNICKEKNILIGIATARSKKSAQEFINIIKPDIAILNSGATIIYNNEVIYNEMMDVNTTKTIINMCKKYTNNKGKILVETDEENFINYEIDKRKRKYIKAIYNDFNNFDYPSYKIIAELKDDDWSKEIVYNLDNCTTHNYKNEIMRRFTKKEINKLNAIKYLEKHLNITSNEILAFGNDYNDLEMLKYCGIGVAVKNAVDKVLENVDYITDTNNDDGVATFIKNNIIKRNN